MIGTVLNAGAIVVGGLVGVTGGFALCICALATTRTAGAGGASAMVAGLSDLGVLVRRPIQCEVLRKIAPASANAERHKREIPGRVPVRSCITFLC